MPGIYASRTAQSSKDNPDKGIVLPLRNGFGDQLVQCVVIRRQVCRELQERSTEEPARPHTAGIPRR